jgi:GT2 family glycosyltransferase
MRARSQDLISVIVVNLERRELLKRCLESLSNQTVEHFELIVVDNGSQDGSADMVAEHFSSDAGHGFLLKLIRNPENRGFCAGNNQGLAAASGSFIALLNNDAEADPNWLEALRRVFDRGATVGMAASKILVYEDPTRIDKAGHLMYPDGQNRGRGSGELDCGQYDRMEETLWPDGCAAMYRREMLDQIGGFDEDFFAYGDDAELGLRARIAGWICFYVPDAVVRHHRGSTLGLLSALRLELIERNRVLLAAKLFPWSLLWLNGAYYTARIAAGLWAAARNKGELRRHKGIRGKMQVAMALVKGDLQALRLLPKMLLKRRDIRKIRRLSPAQVRQLLFRYRITLKELMEQAT